MSKVEKSARIIIKRSNIAGKVPTYPPITNPNDHTGLPPWKTTDIYVGEFFLNQIDQKLWIRVNNSTIKRVLFEGDVSGGGSAGTSGKDGRSGSSGTNGTSGSSGSSGTNGSSGTSGSSGTNGTNGTSGSSGSSGLVKIDISYAAIVEKINSGQLVPGQFYRITDFATNHYLIDYDPNLANFKQAKNDALAPTGITIIPNAVGTNPITYYYVAFFDDLAPGSRSLKSSEIEVTVGDDTTKLIFDSDIFPDWVFEYYAAKIILWRGTTSGAYTEFTYITESPTNIFGNSYSSSMTYEDYLETEIHQVLSITIGATEPIIVLAISPDTLAVEAYSEFYPQDLLHYDWNSDNWNYNLNFGVFDGASAPNILSIVPDAVGSNPVNYTYVAFFVNNTMTWDRSLISEDVDVTIGDDTTQLIFTCSSFPTWASIDGSPAVYIFSRPSIGGNWEARIASTTSEDIFLLSPYPGISPMYFMNISSVHEEQAIISNFKGVITKRHDTILGNHSNHDYRNAKNRVWNITQPAWISGSYSSGSYVSYGEYIFYASDTVTTEEPGVDPVWVKVIAIPSDPYISFSSTYFLIGYYYWIPIVDDIDYEDRYWLGDSCEKNFVPLDFDISAYYGIKIPMIVLGDNCSANEFGYWNLMITMAQYGYYNIFEDECVNNHLGFFNISNLFKNRCYRNVSGAFFSQNTIENECNYNIFGNYCIYNVFGNGCENNILNENCSSNTFGDNFIGNILGYYCQSNAFGNDDNSNIIGDYCIRNKFGDCFHNSVLPANSVYNIFEDGISVGNLSGNTYIIGNYNKTFFANSAWNVVMRYVNEFNLTVMVTIPTGSICVLNVTTTTTTIISTTEMPTTTVMPLSLWFRPEF